MITLISQCAASRRNGSGRNAPASVNGTTTRLTRGIANALATGEMSESCWKSATSIGTIATVIESCSTTAACTRPGRPVRSDTA